MSEYDLGTGLLGAAGTGIGGSTSFMKNIFGARYRGYGTTEVGDQGYMAGGVPSIKGYLGRSQSVSEMFLAVTDVSNQRDKIYKALIDIEDYSLVQTILEIMHDDVLSPDENSTQVFSISSENEQYDSVLKGLEKRLALNELIDDILSDLLLFGEYPFKIFTYPEKGGVKSLDEVLVPTDITPVYKGREITRFLVRTTGTTIAYSQTSYESLSPYDFVSFMRYPRKVRLNTQEKYPFLTDGVAKVGRSIFPLETLEKIKSLYLLEKMLPISRVLQMNRNTLVGVQLGQSMMTKNVIEACREYERYLNSQSSSTASLDINAVIGQVGKFKVIPLLGDKGAIVEQTAGNADHTADAVKDIEEIKNAILTSVGILPGYISGSTDTNAALKAYVRYLRKIDSIQKCIVHGLKHLSLIELNSRGFSKVSPNDVKVVFANNISLANIERLEFLDILVGLVNNYTNYINGLSQDQTISEYIDKIEMLNFVKRKLSYMKGAEGAINLRNERDEDEEETTSSLTEDTSEIDRILRKLPRDVIREAHNNVIKIEKEIAR